MSPPCSSTRSSRRWPDEGAAARSSGAAAVIGILVVAHAPLASALAQAAGHVYACAPEKAAAQLRTLDVAADAEVESMCAAARALIGQIDRGAGTLVLTDAFGATPGNVAARLVEPGRVAVIAGVNLPMLLRALCYRDGTLAQTVDKALAGGTQGVLQVTGTPVQNQASRTVAPGHDFVRIQHQQ
jgi:PTS system mannose-specific IIA component